MVYAANVIGDEEPNLNVADEVSLRLVIRGRSGAELSDLIPTRRTRAISRGPPLPFIRFEDVPFLCVRDYHSGVMQVGRGDQDICLYCRQAQHRSQMVLVAEEEVRKLNNDLLAMLHCVTRVVGKGLRNIG